MPRALAVAVPDAYRGDLFKHSANAEQLHAVLPEKDNETKSLRSTNIDSSQQDGNQFQDGRLKELLDHGRRVKVAGVALNRDKKNSYIIAGSTQDQSPGEIKPVAVRIDSDTMVLKPSGAPASPASIEELQDGMEIVVEGKKNRYGAIWATCAIINEKL